MDASSNTDALVAAGFISPGNSNPGTPKERPTSITSPNATITLPSVTKFVKGANSPSLIDFSDSELPPISLKMLPDEGPPGLSLPLDQGEAILPPFSTSIPRINEELLRLQQEVQRAALARDKEALASLLDKEKEIVELRAHIEAHKAAHMLEIEALKGEIESHKKELSGKPKFEDSPNASANAKILQETVEAFKKTDVAREQFIDYLNGQLQEFRHSPRNHPYPPGPPDNLHVYGAPQENKIVKDMKALEQRHQITQGAFFEHMDRTIAFQNSTNATISNLQRKLTISQTQIKVLKEQFSLAQKLKEEVEYLKNKNATIENNLDEAIAVNSHLTRELETFQTENADLKNKLAVFETENANLKGKLRENNDKLQRSSEKMTKMEKERKTSNNVLHRRGLHVEVMQNTIENLEADKHRLERAAAARSKFDTGPDINEKAAPGLRPSATPFTPSNMKSPDPFEE
ncbi:hypothetical protein TWF718_004595 [Orbilia javanica]|uniref:Uncharacterized protein n=1 Tax=Orbilia javanica TaxID=47235 RepID=A0AAN8NBR8_9PEZI